jgi:hypothetical protein
VRLFWDLQREWSARAEVETGGYQTELSRFLENNPAPTFKQFLLNRRQSDREE